MKTSLEVSLSVHRHSIWQQFIGLCRSTFSSDFFHKVAETFATRILLIGIGLVTSVIVARCLGPEGRGLYAVAATIGAIGVQFGNLGLHASNTYYVARDKILLPTLVGNTLLVSFLFGGFGVFLTLMIFLFWPQLAPLHGLLLILSLLWIPFGLAYLLLQNLLLGIQEVRSYNKIELATKILGVGLLTVVIFLRDVTVEMVFSSGLVALVISFAWAFRRLQSYLVKAPFPSLTLFKENIYYGLKAYLAAFCAFLVIRVDLLMVKYILGSEQTGYYSIAVSMADMVYVLPLVVGSVLFPKLSAMNDRQEKWKLTKQVAMAVGLGTVILAGFAALLSEQIVRLLFGKAFIPAVPPLIWLMPGIIFLSINTILMNYFASIGMPLITVYSPCAAAFLNIGLNMKLIPIWGTVGASIASVVAYGMMLVASLIYLIKQREYSHI